MNMRVTQGMLTGNMMRNLMNSQAQMQKYFDQVNTGKKISKPSDDPVIAMKGMNYRTQVAGVEQYKRNVGEAHNWMDNSDAALDKTTQTLQRLRELTIKASNSTNDTAELDSIKKEVEQLEEHIIDLANTNVNGKYIFNGSNTKDKPVKTENGEITDYPIAENDVFINVGNGMKIKANVSPASVFTEDFFGRISDLKNALSTEGDRADLNASIEAMDQNINDTINARADLGARMNRMELVENRLDEQSVIAKKIMSENEDIDFAVAITNLITQESLHRAALAAGSRIIQPSLLDFLR